MSGWDVREFACAPVENGTGPGVIFNVDLAYTKDGRPPERFRFIKN